LHDTYGQVILDAMDAVRWITWTEQTAIIGCCSGGMLFWMVAAHPGAHRPAARGRGVLPDRDRAGWPDYASWLTECRGEEKAAPQELGGGGLEPICDSPRGVRL